MQAAVTSVFQHTKGQLPSTTSRTVILAATALTLLSTTLVILLSVHGYAAFSQGRDSSRLQRIGSAARTTTAAHNISTSDRAAGTWTAAAIGSRTAEDTTQWLCSTDQSTSVHSKAATRACSTSRFAVILLITGSDSLAVHPTGQAALNYAWLTVANKRAYTEKHGYALYLVADAGLVSQDRKAPWAKFVAVKAVMAARPQHEWLMVIDADAFFMNLSVQLSEITRIAEDIARLELRTADVVVARDCNTINSGSIMFRNSPWTRDHLSELYNTNGSDVWNADIWWENAAIVHLHKKQPAVREHYVLLSQNVMNAYPGDCASELKYKEGLFILHFAGNQKLFMPAFISKVPISKHGAAHTDAGIQSNMTTAALDSGLQTQQQDDSESDLQQDECVQVLLPAGSLMMVDAGMLNTTSALIHTAANAGSSTLAGVGLFTPAYGAECFTSDSNLRGTTAFRTFNHTVVNDTLTQVIFIDSSIDTPSSWRNKGWPLKRPS